MKHVLIDLDRLKNINTGLGQVALFFGKKLSEIDDKEIKFTFLVPKKYKGYFGNKVNYETVSLKRRWFPFLCKSFDLWYALHQDSAYFPSNKNTPYILTIHDLNFLSEKSFRKAKKRLKKLQKKVNRATHITVISEFTKKEVSENLQVSGKNIQVIYNGVEIKKFPDTEKPSYVPEGDILLSLGVVKEKKNTAVLIPFIEKLPEKYKLIIAGNKSSDYADKIAFEIKKRALKNRVRMPGEISNKDKYWLLKNCKAVLFPSKHEGMGIPPIEAMRFGKPVFASEYSSIPEICEDKAYYLKNFNPAYMSRFFLEKINEFYADKTKPEILKKHSEKFLWEKNSAEYLKLFKAILKQDIL